MIPIIGLFTYQRPDYLKRQLSLFSLLNLKCRLIVLDGSESEIFYQKNKSIAEFYKHEYIHERSLQARHVLLNEKLDSDYVAYAADDDLIIPDFYINASKFLDQNPMYSVVSGRIPTLNYIKKYLWLGYYYRNHLDNTYDFYHGDFLERLLRRDQSYYLGCPPTFYGVRRSVVHQTFAKYVADLKQFSSMERLEAISNCIHGGMRVLDEVMGLRDYSSEPTRNVERDDPEQYICDEDIHTLQEVIRLELKSEIPSSDLLNYFSQYAWLLPVRGPQKEKPSKESKSKIAIECLMNKCLIGGPFDKRVSRAIRCAQSNLTKEL